VTRLCIIEHRVTNDDGGEQTRTNIYALSGIQTHGLSVQAIKAYALEHVAPGTGRKPIRSNGY
jgi:hypothetical protein